MRVGVEEGVITNIGNPTKEFQELDRLKDELTRILRLSFLTKKEIKKLNEEYQQGILDYKEYKRRKDRILNGKSLKQFLSEQNFYAYTIIKRMIFLLDKLILQVYNTPNIVNNVSKVMKEQVMKERVIKERVMKESKPTQLTKPTQQLTQQSTKQSPPHLTQRSPTQTPTQPSPRTSIQPSVHSLIQSQIQPTLHKKQKTQKKQYIKHFISELRKELEGLKHKTRHETKHETRQKIKYEARQKVKLGTRQKIRQRTQRTKQKTIQTIQGVKLQHDITNNITKHYEKLEIPHLVLTKEEKELLRKALKKKSIRVRESSGVSISLLTPTTLFFKKTLHNFISRLKKSQDIVGDKTEVPLTVETLKVKKKIGLEHTYLRKEAERIKALVEKERVYKEYSTTTIAAISNLFVRKLTLKLLDLFPDFFKGFYKKLRSASIGVLSNTYVNIMVFFTILSFLFSFLISTIIFFILKNTLLASLFRGFIIGLVTSTLTFLMFYYHPIVITQQKIKDIKRNLPFALTQMAAVASSGIPPLVIFKLVAKKNEYGEVSKELGRIVEYVELFGIDFLIAIKTIASITPSDFFKEFLNGLVSTIESGGELKTYFKQKADEALTVYRLERQKYNATISTLSDIYTALLIAAPLLLLATLSLINMLGGKISGVGINTILFVGTYIIIPLANIIFIIILKITQPNV